MPLADTARLIASLELKDKFTGALSNAGRAIDGFDRKTRTLSKIGGQVSRGWGNAIGNIERWGLIAGTAAAGGVIAVTKAAMDYEQAFAGIKKTVDETDLRAAGSSFQKLSDDIRAMAREIPIAATDLALIGEAAGALGIKAGDLEEFTRVVAELSVTTNLTTDSAATSLGHLGTILHLTGDEYRAFGDTLVNLGNKGASTEDQIVELAERFAAAGHSAGLSNNDILALASAVASMGVEVEAGGSALSRVFNNVATNIGTSSAKAAEFAKALGMSADEFKLAWGRDALGTFELFLGKLNTLDQFEAANLLKKVGISNTRDVNVVRLMGQNIGFVNDALENSRTSVGALGVEAGKRFETTASKVELLKNNLRDVAITIGNAVLPKVVELSGKLISFLNEPKSQQAIKDFAAKIPGAIDELVKIAQKIPWQSIGDSLKVAGAGAKTLLDAFLGLPMWVQTAVLTSWGLNKLTGGAVGGIIGELGKGLIKGVLGMNAGVVNIKAGVVTGVGGAGGAGGVAATAGKGAGVLSSLKVLGSLFIAGVALEKLFEQWGVFEKQVHDASAAVMEKVALIPDKTYAQAIAAVDTLEGTLERNSGDLVKHILMQTGSGRNETIAAFEGFAANLAKTAQTPAERAAATAALGKLAEEISLSFGNTGQDQAALLAQLQAIANRLNDTATGTAGAFSAIPEAWRKVAETQTTALAAKLDPIAAATSGALNSLNGKIEVTNSALDQIPDRLASFSTDFAAKWGALRDELVAQGMSHAETRRGILAGLGISAGKLDQLTTVMRSEVAAKLGISVDELRNIKRGADHNEEVIAAKLGISVEQLRLIRDGARDTAAGVVTLNNKDWKPVINVKNTTNFNVSARLIAQEVVTYRTQAGRRGVGII